MRNFLQGWNKATEELEQKRVQTERGQNLLKKFVDALREEAERYKHLGYFEVKEQAQGDFQITSNDVVIGVFKLDADGQIKIMFPRTSHQETVNGSEERFQHVMGLIGYNLNYITADKLTEK